MERIQTAIEKAKRSGRSRKPSVIEKITYTQTKTVEVNPEILRKNRVIAGFDAGHWVDSFRVLRTRILHKIKEHNWNLIGITSPETGTGKSLIATNLAISLAMEVDRTVLLIDANLRDPHIHHLLGLSPAIGLSDYLTGEYPLNELFIHPNIDHLVFLPGGKAAFNSTELLACRKMAQLVWEVKDRYASRIVIFDLPPLLNRADALAFSPYVNAVLLVIEEGKSRSEDIKHSVDLLTETHFLGTVLNKSHNPKISYHK